MAVDSRGPSDQELLASGVHRCDSDNGRGEDVGRAVERLADRRGLGLECALEVVEDAFGEHPLPANEEECDALVDSAYYRLMEESGARFGNFAAYAWEHKMEPYHAHNRPPSRHAPPWASRPWVPPDSFDGTVDEYCQRVLRASRRRQREARKAGQRTARRIAELRGYSARSPQLQPLSPTRVRTARPRARRIAVRRREASAARSGDPPDGEGDDGEQDGELAEVAELLACRPKCPAINTVGCIPADRRGAEVEVV